MMFVNAITGEELSYIDFVTFVWEEAERQFNDCHEDKSWCDLTNEEQIEQYCYQMGHQLYDRNWEMAVTES